MILMTLEKLSFHRLDPGHGPFRRFAPPRPFLEGRDGAPAPGPARDASRDPQDGSLARASSRLLVRLGVALLLTGGLAALYGAAARLLAEPVAHYAGFAFCVFFGWCLVLIGIGEPY
jgi:hypothetical protein